MKTAGAIPSKLRSLSELPQAKAELDALALRFGNRSAVATGAEATERAVKASAALPTAQFVVFSTHGLLATEIGDNAEPGLVFTPPADAAAASDNDGLLTASEAAGLRLAADLVVLSACNTAAPSGKPGAEGLSGLARAFLFAGARSMLVSHWAVSDEATSRLMQETFALIEGGNVETRAAALQSAMRTLRKADNGRFSDPRYWAPFMLVGEPGR
jgi:CHAT domain-containing protein